MKFCLIELTNKDGPSVQLDSFALFRLLACSTNLFDTKLVLFNPSSMLFLSISCDITLSCKKDVQELPSRIGKPKNLNIDTLLEANKCTDNNYLNSSFIEVKTGLLRM